MTSTATVIPMDYSDDELSIIRVTDTWWRGTASRHGHRLTFWGSTPALVGQRWGKYKASARCRREVALRYRTVEQLGSPRSVPRLQPGMRVRWLGRGNGVYTIAATGENRGRRMAWLNAIRGAVPLADLYPAREQPIELETLA